MEKIAIYDLDRTVLKHATYTPFLLFAARRRSPMRLILAPVWVAVMIGYKLGLLSRGRLKQVGLDLFLGPNVHARDLGALSSAFAGKVVPGWLAPGARAAIMRDRADGCRLVMATAAFEFYARDIAEALDFDHLVATRHDIRPDQPGRCRIVGENCYGAQKVPRIAALLSEIGLAREECHLRFYSDSVSDAPLFAWCDEAVLVDVGAKGQRVAQREGWATARFRD